MIGVENADEDKICEEIQSKLDYWFEIHFQNLEMFKTAESGTASHVAYKNFESIFKVMLQTEDCNFIYQKFKLLTIFSNKNSDEYKIYEILMLNGSSYEQSLKAIKQLASNNNIGIWDFLKDYARFVNIDINELKNMSITKIRESYSGMQVEASQKELKIGESDTKEIALMKILQFMTVHGKVSDHIKTEFYENLNKYAMSINVDIGDIINQMTQPISGSKLRNAISRRNAEIEEENSTGYEKRKKLSNTIIGNRRDKKRIENLEKYYSVKVNQENPDITIIQILKQMTLFKELSVMMRSDDIKEEAICSKLLEWNKNIPINSKNAIEKFFKMLGWRDSAIDAFVRYLVSANSSIKNSEKSLGTYCSIIENSIRKIRKKCIPVFFEVDLSGHVKKCSGTALKERILSGECSIIQMK